jgi:hypothetical protein
VQHTLAVAVHLHRNAVCAVLGGSVFGATLHARVLLRLAYRRRRERGGIGGGGLSPGRLVGSR